MGELQLNERPGVVAEEANRARHLELAGVGADGDEATRGVLGQVGIVARSSELFAPVDETVQRVWWSEGTPTRGGRARRYC